MTSSQDYCSKESIENLVEKDLNISQQLLLLLEQELPLIKQRDYEGLKQIVIDKAPLLEQLREHSELRKQWLLSFYKVASENNWEKLLAQYNAIEVEKQWQQVKETIEHCKTINDRNGLLITRGLKSHSRLLQLMKGGSVENTLYTAKGGQQNSNYGNSLTQA